MDRPIHTAPAQQQRICGVDDGVYVQLGDVGLEGAEGGHGVFRVVMRKRSRVDKGMSCRIHRSVWWIRAPRFIHPTALLAVAVETTSFSRLVVHTLSLVKVVLLVVSAF
jgi:hypothetical protein